MVHGLWGRTDPVPQALLPGVRWNWNLFPSTIMKAKAVLTIQQFQGTQSGVISICYYMDIYQHSIALGCEVIHDEQIVHVA